METISAAALLPRDETNNQNGLFASTSWTVVFDAAQSKLSPTRARTALAQLCALYWRPLYLFLRRQGYNSDDAQDLTQDFFAHIIEARLFARAEPARGRFRSFLLGALKRFLNENRNRQRAQKRGGGIAPLPLDEAAIAEADAQNVRCENWSPDRTYEREWALALLRRVIETLEGEHRLSGKQVLFDSLKSYLAAGSEKTLPYQELSTRLLRPVATLRSDVARLRTRYRAILREEVRSTVSDVDEIEEELRHLRAVMAS